jgi:topoisomerase IA-like protein
MENKNIFLGKLQKQGCYINNGKYGYFLTCDKKNYKIPEWLKPEEITLSIAERYIAYKKKISEEWNNNKENVFVKSDGDESESDGEPVIKEMVLTKKNTK